VGAIEDWKQALDAGPPNPMLLMLLGQAYFATGSYREATVTTQTAMHALPQDQWGVVVSNRGELYRNSKSYLVQLEQLESAVHENPQDAAQRFLLAFQYAFLGYPQPAVRELDKVVELEPRDEMAEELRQTLVPRLPAPGAPVITPGVVTRAPGR
jgi:thioredoxin-like negative regulator of GroEL